MALPDDQRALLDQPLDPKLGAQRKADRGRDVSYLEGYQAIAQANRIFGYDGWSYRVDDIAMTAMSDGRAVLYTAQVTVEALGCTRQDTGCVPIRNSVDSYGKEKDNVNNPDQHDLARKGAVTDALKRALRSFGDQFGNSLYDKDSDLHQAIHEAVAEEQRQQRQGQRVQQQQAPAPVKKYALPKDALKVMDDIGSVGTLEGLNAISAALSAATKDGVGPYGEPIMTTIRQAYSSRKAALGG